MHSPAVVQIDQVHDGGAVGAPSKFAPPTRIAPTGSATVPEPTGNPRWYHRRHLQGPDGVPRMTRSASGA